jgi:hypothetical protein
LAIILAVSLLFSFIACSGGGSEDTSTTSTVSAADRNPNLTVTTNPAEIPNFNADKGYTAATTAQAEAILEEVMGELNDLLASPSFSMNFSIASARSIITERLDIGLSDLLEDMEEELGPYANINGYVRATISMHEENFVPFSLNGDTKFRLELSEGFEDEGFEIIGVIAGEGTVNIRLTASSESGTVRGAFNCAINIANMEEKIWVKLVIAINMNINLSGSEDVIISYNVRAYGEGSDPLAIDSGNLEINLDDFLDL